MRNLVVQTCSPHFKLLHLGKQGSQGGLLEAEPRAMLSPHFDSYQQGP